MVLVLISSLTAVLSLINPIRLSYTTHLVLVSMLLSNLRLISQEVSFSKNFQLKLSLHF
jgi:hypothetical protein